MNRREFIYGMISIGIGTVTGACVYDPGPGHGPPPHAPAHGYRYRHPHGVDLVYDAGIGGYVVLGMPRYYFIDGHFFRFHRDRWQRSRRLKGNWRRHEHDRLPRGLRRKPRRKKSRRRGRKRDRD